MTETKKPDLGMQTRMEVLETAVVIEKFSSLFIANILDIEIKNIKDSRTLGNKSSSLSFSQKIDLLIDLGALKDGEKKKFQFFMEIRNQFMHNFDAISYKKCYEFLSGTEKGVLKLYPPADGQSKEASLKAATHSLCMEVEKLTLGIIGKVKDNWVRKKKNDVNQIVHDGLLNTIRGIAELISNLADKEVATGARLESEAIKKIGREAQTHLVNSYITLLNEGLNKKT